MIFFSFTCRTIAVTLLRTALLSLSFLSFSAASAEQDVLSEDIRRLMEENKLAGFSVAVVDDYKLVYEGAFGVKEVGRPEAVDRHTAFSAASISKSITGLVAAMLAEDGVLDLDAPVSRYLKRWQLPDSAFTKHSSITLRHLLTHTAGTSQGGFADFFPGDDIPTIIESLQGKKLPRYKTPIDVMWQPGSRFRYSGGGYVIAQVAIEDVTGKSLADLAEEMIFTPLGMADTTFRQNGEAGFLKNVASAHMADLSLAGAGGVPIYPQIAASGLWTTPGDMTLLLIDMQLALAGRGSRAITPAVAREATRIQTLLKAGGWGLGWMRYEKFGNLDWFSHSGFNTGIGGFVMATMEGGRAIALFGNGVPNARVPVIDAVVDHVVKARGWRKEIKSAHAPAADTVRRFVGYYRNINNGYFSPFHEVVRVYEDNGQLMMDNSLGMHAPELLIHLGAGAFRWDEFRGNAFGPYQAGDKDTLAFFHEDAPEPGVALEKLPDGRVPPYQVARSEGFESAKAAYDAWQADYPDSYLMNVGAFRQLAVAAKERSDVEEALVFYRLGSLYHPDNEEFRAEMEALQAAVTQ